MADTSPQEVHISSEGDIVLARKTVRELADHAGFGITDVTRIVTAASELARNVFLYAGSGVLRCRVLGNAERLGIELTVEDRGPGIANIDQVMQVGFSTSKGLGLGLPGTRRLMDEMEIQSEVGKGTRVTVKRWKTRREDAADPVADRRSL